MQPTRAAGNKAPALRARDQSRISTRRQNLECPEPASMCVQQRPCASTPLQKALGSEVMSSPRKKISCSCRTSSSYMCNRQTITLSRLDLTQGRTGIPSACDQGHPFTKVGETLPFSQLFPGAVRLPERERSEARERAGQRGHGGKWPSEFCAAAFTLSQRPEICAFRRPLYSGKASVATASCLHTWALRGGEPLYTIPGALSPCPRHVASCQRRTWAVCACWTQAA